MLQMQENEISLCKCSGGTTQLPIWCDYINKNSTVSSHSMNC